MTLVQYATVEVAGQLFGVAVSRVREVLRCGECTPVPLAPDHVVGLFNLRGEVVTALDLGVRLGLPAAARGRAMNVIVRGEDGWVGLVVDRIGDVVELDDGSAEPIPQTLTGPARGLVTCTYPLGERLLLVLDAPAVAHDDPARRT